MKQILNELCSSSSSLQNRGPKFVTIYISEAHASDGWYFPFVPHSMKGQPGCIKNHVTIEDRINAAKAFSQAVDFPQAAEIVVDAMNDQLCDAYEAWPERLYIVVRGVVVYKGGQGPFGYRLEEVQRWLSNNNNNNTVK